MFEYRCLKGSTRAVGRLKTIDWMKPGNARSFIEGMIIHIHVHIHVRPSRDKETKVTRWVDNPNTSRNVTTDIPSIPTLRA